MIIQFYLQKMFNRYMAHMQIKYMIYFKKYTFNAHYYSIRYEKINYTG